MVSKDSQAHQLIKASMIWLISLKKIQIGNANPYFVFIILTDLQV